MPRGQKVQIIKQEKPHSIEEKVDMAIHNRFDVEVVRDGEVMQQAYAENIVLDRLWTRLLAPNTYFNAIHFGTGTGTLSASRTSLFTYLGAGALGIVPIGASDKITVEPDLGWASLRRQIQLAPEAFVGSTLTEVGIGYGTAAANLVTHAMLRDMNGNQITIEKTSTDIINIYATVFVHWNPDGYDNGHIRVGITKSWETIYYFSEFTFMHWLMGVSGLDRSCVVYGGAVHSFNGLPTSNHYGSTYSFSLPNKSVTLTLSQLSVSSSNLSKGISALAFLNTQAVSASNSVSNNVPYLIIESQSTHISKSQIENEPIATGNGVTKDFATRFPFPKNATVFVDNVAESNVQINPDSPGSTNIGIFFKTLVSESTYISSFNWNMSGSAQNYRFGEHVWYNPLWEFGVKSFQNELVYSSHGSLSWSNDLQTWTEINRTSGSFPTTTLIPENAQYAKYWKLRLSKTRNYSPYITNVLPVVDTTYNIHFDTPPPVGAVITANYDTPVIAKDANHVFDFSLTIQLGEKTS